MTSKLKLTLLSSAAAVMTLMGANSAHATYGMLPHCVGTAKCGKGGAGSARADAAVDASINPALAAKMDNEYQVNLGWFWADVRGRSGVSSEQNLTKSGADNFPNGSVGVNYRLDDRSSFNISIVPGGGGASEWATSRSNNFFANSTQDNSINYEMIYIQPSYARTYGNASYGIGAIISRATMETDSARGNFTTSGVEDTKETFYGVGFQIGGVWDLTESGSFGLSVRSPVWHQDTGAYDNVVFTDPIDTPMQMVAGIAFDATDSTNLSADVKWVNWGGVDTIGNEVNLSCSSCRGFGWKDQIIVMLGIEHKWDDATTLRAGYSHGNSPIDNGHVLANYLFPAIVEDHFTVGAEYDMGGGMQLGASAYMTPRASRVDDRSIFGATSGVTRDSYLRHSQKGFQISFSNDF